MIVETSDSCVNLTNVYSLNETAALFHYDPSYLGKQIKAYTGKNYTALIREKTPLSSVDFELLRQKPQFMAFSAEKRREMFGR